MKTDMTREYSSTSNLTCINNANICVHHDHVAVVANKNPDSDIPLFGNEWLDQDMAVAMNEEADS
jgi:hypothetical protein